MLEESKLKSKLFFDYRSFLVGKNPSMEDLSFISGRDYRIWSIPLNYEAMINSIADILEVTDKSKVIEIGCAAGFIAYAIAKKISKYVGVDMAKNAIKVARRLEIPNAEFQVANGERLPYPDNFFDAAFCYDVVTNFPHFSMITEIIKDMLRVVKPGGKVLIGSIPDSDKSKELSSKVAEYQKVLTQKYGPLPEPTGFKARLKKILWTSLNKNSGSITCYQFSKQDFISLGKQLNIPVEIIAVHPEHPYSDYRFNARYLKPDQ